MKKIDHKELKKFKWNKVDEVVEKLKSIINDEEYAPEQKLFMAGYVLDRNKEYYINELKHNFKLAEGELKTYKNNNYIQDQEYRKQMKADINLILKALGLVSKPVNKPVQKPAPKKKIIIVKKKTV